MKIIRWIMLSIIVISLTFLLSFDNSNLDFNTVSNENSVVFVQSDMIEQNMFPRHSDSESQIDDDVNQAPNDHEELIYILFLRQINEDDIRNHMNSLGYSLDEASDRETYKRARLLTVKELTSLINNTFIDTYELDENQVIYLSLYTTTLIIRINQKTLRLVKSDPMVNSISIYEPLDDLIAG